MKKAGIVIACAVIAVLASIAVAKMSSGDVIEASVPQATVTDEEFYSSYSESGSSDNKAGGYAAEKYEYLPAEAK